MSIAVLRISIDTGLLILIWIVQLIIYPSFHRMQPEGFVAWHADYMRRISWIVGPLMLGQVAVLGWQLLRGVHWHIVFSLLAVAGCWFVTWRYSVPCHETLQKQGWSAETITQLVRSSWARTLLWTLTWVLAWKSMG